MIVEKTTTTSEFLCDRQTICSSSVQYNILDSQISLNSVVTSIKTTTNRFLPNIRSGSHTDIGPRSSNEDAHIQIDDLHVFYPVKTSFYAVFDGHGGSEASSFLKQNVMTLLFQDINLLRPGLILDNNDDEKFFKHVEDCNRNAFLLADQALENECSVSDYCGATALTVLVIGRRLLIANAGDCRAVLSRKGGVAVQMTQDHRPSCLQEKKRVEELGGYFKDGYLNGEIAVTRALGDRYMKKSSPLIAEPEVKQMVLTEDDEFMIIGCDGIWDVMSNQEAVSLVRRQLSQHNDPQRCATELINQALRLDTSDNLTAIVVCFSSNAIATNEPQLKTKPQAWRPKFRCNALSEEARNKQTSLLQGN